MTFYGIGTVQDVNRSTEKPPFIAVLVHGSGRPLMAGGFSPSVGCAAVDPRATRLVDLGSQVMEKSFDWVRYDP